MATAAQIQANRLNAQKSTGPRTPEGKERASQNAIKHGLLAREAVVRGEDPGEFEVYREEMLEDLSPAGTVETMLAEPEGVRHWEPGPGGEPGKVATEVIAGHREERGGEGKNAATREPLVRSPGSYPSDSVHSVASVAQTPISTSDSQSDLPADQQAATPAKLASFDAEASLGGVSSAGGRASRDDSDFTRQPSHFKLQEKITHYGVTTNEEGCATGAGAETLHASPFTLHDRSCETNPIAGGPAACEESAHDSIGGGKCGIVPWIDGATGG